MSDLKATFEEAAQAATNLAKKPDNNAMLQLYAFYKQATVGDVQCNRPGFSDFIARAKYDAWSKVKGTTQDGAMQSYIDLVKKLQG